MDFLKSEYVSSSCPSTVIILSPVLKPASVKIGLVITKPSSIESNEIEDEP